MVFVYCIQWHLLRNNCCYMCVTSVTHQNMFAIVIINRITVSNLVLQIRDIICGMLHHHHFFH